MIAPLRRARAAATTVAALGLDWAIDRAGHEVRLRSGLLERRLPLLAWEQIPLPALPGGASDHLGYRRDVAGRFLCDPRELARTAPFGAWDEAAQPAESPIEAADAAVAGRFRFFSHHWHDLGEEPDWHRNAESGDRLPGDRHWSRIGDFGAGDIKVVWEPSRFAFTFDLVRAYARTGDERYPARWWNLIHHWASANPPNAGPNWKCGQETSLRAMAWCFGLHGFLHAARTTEADVRLLTRMLAFSGVRVEAVLQYALSQRNNHGVSEGMGLFTIGSLFPEFRAAARWEQAGRDVLERLARGLIYDDGGFSQHSVTYHRLMLDDYLWSIRLAERSGRPLSDELRGRVSAAGVWLERLTDPGTGQAPVYGANDGARVLPLSSTGYRDMRPTVQAAAGATGKPLPYEPGPWDEALAWLGIPAGVERSMLPAPRASATPESGVLVIRSDEGFAAGHAARFRHRPGHADLLHVDVWWRGVNVALDPGTFSYNAPGPLPRALSATAAHNTVTVDGRDQMDKVSRFLWAPWAAGAWSLVEERGCLAYAEGWHDGYARLHPPARHRRGIVRLPRERWVIVDEVTSAGPADVRLHWLLADAEHVLQSDEHGAWLDLDLVPGRYRVQCAVAGETAAATVVRGDEESARGWRSEYYQSKTPALSLALEVRKQRARLLFWSVLGPDPWEATSGQDAVRVRDEHGECTVRLGRSSVEPLVTEVELPDGRLWPTREGEQ